MGRVTTRSRACHLTAETSVARPETLTQKLSLQVISCGGFACSSVNIHLKLRAMAYEFVPRLRAGC
jgi:hypothetical protein